MKMHLAAVDINSSHATIQLGVPTSNMGKKLETLETREASIPAFPHQAGMISNNSVVSVPERRMSSSTASAWQPFHATPDSWGSSHVAYVGQDMCENKEGCSQKKAAPPSGGWPQMHDLCPSGEFYGPGGYVYTARPTPPGGAIEDPTRCAPNPQGLHHPPTRSSLVSYPPRPAAAAPVPYDATAARIGWAHFRLAKDHSLGKYCRGEGPIPPSNSFDWNKPTDVCETRGRADMRLIQHEGITDGQEGRERGAKLGHTVTVGNPGSFPSEAMMPGVDANRVIHCEHPGCTKTPKYGHTGGLLSFCQSHKRVGMYTNRNGNVLVATRDGNAFRAVAGSTSAQENPTRAADSEVSRPAPLTMEQSEDSRSCPLQAVDASSPPTAKLALYRKLCEVPGCQIQPSYGPHGTTRPRFCVGHKTKDMVGLKNRPCLFPGCTIRPHYGLSGGRPVYCVSHKKSTMLHLLKESMIMAKDRTERKRAEARVAAGERRALALAQRKTCMKPQRGVQVEELDGNDNGEELRGVKGARSSRQKVVIARKGESGTQDEDQSTASAAPSSPSSYSSSSESASTLDDEAHSARVPSATSLPRGAVQSPRTSRLRDASGMAPSAEFKLLQEVRASARAEAEASGSGRRPRAPSRKLLEASGRLKYEGAQWMTKEIKDAEAKKLKDLKEKRKRYKAAGLKAGQVVEECSIPTAGTGSTGFGTKGSGSDGGVRDATGGRVPEDKHSWRQLTTAEILQQARLQTVLVKRRQHQAGSSSTSVSEGRPVSHEWTTRVGTGMPASARSTEESVKKRKESVSNDDEALRGSVQATESDNTSEAKRSKLTKDQKSDQCTQSKQAASSKMTGGGKFTSSGIVHADEPVRRNECEFVGCSKTADFGVNGAVRYW